MRSGTVTVLTSGGSCSGGGRSSWRTGRLGRRNGFGVRANVNRERGAGQFTVSRRISLVRNTIPWEREPGMNPQKAHIWGIWGPENCHFLSQLYLFCNEAGKTVHTLCPRSGTVRKAGEVTLPFFDQTTLFKLETRCHPQPKRQDGPWPLGETRLKRPPISNTDKLPCLPCPTPRPP